MQVFVTKYTDFNNPMSAYGKNMPRNKQFFVFCPELIKISGCVRITQKWLDGVDAVHSGRSRIVVYGGGDIVFDTKRANQRNSVDAVTQWTQYTVDAVCSGCSRIVVYGGGDIVFDTKKVKPEHAVDAVYSTQ